MLEHLKQGFKRRSRAARIFSGKPGRLCCSA